MTLFWIGLMAPVIVLCAAWLIVRNERSTIPNRPKGTSNETNQ